MTYSLCFSRPRFFRGKTTGSRQTVERTPTSSGGILFTTRRRSAPMNCEVVMKLLWHMLWDLSSNFQKKNPDVFSTAHLGENDTFTTVTMENIPWVTHFEASKPWLTSSYCHKSRKRSCQGLGSDPHFTMNHLKTTKTSVVYQPGRQGNYHKLYIPYIYIYFFVCI